MPFASSIEDQTGFFKIILEEINCCKIEIFSFGALLNKFSVSVNGIETNVIKGYNNISEAVEKIDQGFWSAKLSPFVCRLRDGEYIFKNETQKIRKFYLGTEALHGLLYDAKFSIKTCTTNADAAFVILEYVYDKQNEGFPFPFSMEVKYELEADNLLRVTTTVVNVGDDDMPLADGWHPYFTFQQPVDEIELQLNTNKMVAFDEKLLPTGNLVPYDKFAFPEKIGNIHFDHCFKLDKNTVVACILEDTVKRLLLKIMPDKSYRYLQIFTPEDRQSIAIENLSSAPDSFNNNMDLIILKPDQSKSFSTCFQLVTL